MSRLAVRVVPVVLLFVVALLSSPAALARRHEIVDPAPVPVPSGLGEKAVAAEIKRTLAGRTWVVTGEKPGHIDARLNLRKHVVVIAIDYDARSVRLKYVSSENLDYKEKNGRRLIHGNYLSWIQNLTQDLARNLQIAQGMQ